MGRELSVRATQLGKVQRAVMGAASWWWAFMSRRSLSWRLRFFLAPLANFALCSGEPGRVKEAEEARDMPYEGITAHLIF